MKLNLSMTDLTFSVSPNHCNKMAWEGCITKLGTPSDGAPGGAQGRRIVITQEAAFTNHKTFEGMPLNCTFGEGFFGSGEDVFTGHGDLIIGYIERAWIEGDSLMASGFIWKNNHPDVAFQAMNAKNSLGFSVEMFCPNCELGEDDGFVYVKEFTGTGCAMLFSECAAFGDTYIKELVARRMKGEELNMNKEEMQAMISASIDTAVDKVSELFASKVADTLEKLVAIEAQMASIHEGVCAEEKEAHQAEVDELKAEVEELKAGKAELETKVAEITAEKEALAQEKAELEVKASADPVRKTADHIGTILAKFSKESDAGVGANKDSFADTLKANIAAGLSKE